MQQTIRDLLSQCPGLSKEDRDKLEGVARGMPFVADISRSDLLLYARCGEQEALLIAQARPHSIMPVHADDLCGTRVSAREEAEVIRALQRGHRVKGSRRSRAGGAPAIREISVVRGAGGKAIAALNVEANLIAYVRQKSRSKVFQRAVRLLQAMLLLGELEAVDTLSPFREHDGVLVVDSRRVTRYASGIATEHYRRLGYLDSLVGRHLSTLDTGDYALFRDVYRDLSCYEREYEERQQRVWSRKAVPLIARSWGEPRWRPWEWLHRRPVGVLFTIHDATEERHKERELKVKSAMIQEIHHRVKNNLQTVAAVLRMQIRRSGNPEVKQILRDSINRILSMAVVHEYLSSDEGTTINIREVTQRIIQQTKQAILSPEKRIRILLEDGHNLYLPARQATACALVINELLQNAVEHGYEERNVGTISVELADEGDQVRIVIRDDGEGLPPDFEIGQTTSLGLQIVQTLVQDDLQGSLEMESGEGVQATVRFSKKILEGEEHWNGQG